MHRSRLRLILGSVALLLPLAAWSNITELYVGARFNTVNGTLSGIANDINVQRRQVGGGGFVTPNVLSKIEFVQQDYNNFPTSDIRSGGTFKGFMVEGVVAF